MRVLVLATAALAALTIASVTPAAAQVKAEALARLCPDLTLNQIGTGLGDLIEQYDFSQNQDEAAMQAASLLCGYGGETAEAPAQGPAQQANVVQEAVIAPPPHFNGSRPHFNGPHPRFAPPLRKTMPPTYGAPRLPPPHLGYAPRRPAPVVGYAPRPLPPRAVVAGAGGYAGHQYRKEAPRALPLTTTERGENYCESEEQLMSKMPRGYARDACVIGEVPGKPCPGWKCRRSR